MQGVLVLSLMYTVAPTKGTVVQRDAVNLRCGSFCLYIALKALDISVPTFPAFESRLGQPGRIGYSMQELAEAAQAYGAHTVGVETTLEDLKERPGRFACIALLEKGHFVNIYDIDGGLVYIIDPPGQREVALDAFRTTWSGKALLLSDRPIKADTELRSAAHRSSFLKYCAILFFLALLATIGVRYARRPAD